MPISNPPEAEQRVYHGSFSSPVATGTQVITGIGFRPTAVIFHWTDFQEACLGFSNQTLNFYLGPTYSNNSKCIVAMNSANANYLAGIIQSFDANGFTIDWNQENGSSVSKTINFIAIK